MDSEIKIPVVDDQDQIIGYEEKLLVHRKGLLHRAFSILVFNDNGELLIHKRAYNKYHSSGLWTNTCCGHPNPGESMEDAVSRRLEEEMGFTCDLFFGFKFHYKTTFDNGLTENEIDHVYFGKYNDDFVVNPDEVVDFKWVSMDEVRSSIDKEPEAYSYWFKEILVNEAFEEVL
ncbi:isopentenyl-diphosphate Delta-isomerase [Emticicia sp. CRIBPO]|uniref:isopentenyl-diphosphate Delta-isomerase n=1 Tax=Emticicia sp. CRIBPO TaxID=2683258 RepID=UPI0014127C42|nr:isopentenyl-diphosphate Delta-isomerase [Emticicia sp. CRIBPO]NBA87192.1 isopentenyl-diphosphate Delta-isomerase [Emticicia sp. CRIBPO]